MTDICIKALVSGRVQGVFFRDSTRRKALQLNISGHAINLPDGRVEVLAYGEESNIEELIGWLHQGPEYASVSSVHVEPLEMMQPSGFIIG